jgi:hypothetical protein
MLIEKSDFSLPFGENIRALLWHVKNEHGAWGNTAGRKQRAASRRQRLEVRRRRTEILMGERPLAAIMRFHDL